MNAIIANYPVGYIHANNSGIVRSVLNGGGALRVLDDPSGGSGSNTSFPSRQLFEPWLKDTDDGLQTSRAVIFFINDTGCTLTQDGDPIYDGGALESQPVLPDGKTVGQIPAGFTTDRGTHLGFGRFVLSAATFGQGGGFHGSGMALKMKATSGSFSQSFGIFVAGSYNGYYGLDVCANVDGVDMQSRFDNGANKTTTPLGTLCTDHKDSIGLQAVIMSRLATNNVGNATPLVFVHVTG